MVQMNNGAPMVLDENCGVSNFAPVCPSSYCNYNGIVSGLEPDCSCTCSAEWDGEQCEIPLTVEVEHTFGGITEEEFDEHESTIIDTIADAAGVHPSQVTIIGVTSVERLRRLLSSELIVNFKITTSS